MKFGKIRYNLDGELIVIPQEHLGKFDDLAKELKENGSTVDEEKLMDFTEDHGIYPEGDLGKYIVITN